MGFESSYDIGLRVLHKDVVTFNKKSQTSIGDSKGFTDFTLSFKDYTISKDGKSVSLPFMGKFSIQVRSLNSMETGGGFSKSNVTIELGFDIPGAILTNEHGLLTRKKEWSIIPMLALASRITNIPGKPVRIFYSDRPDEVLIIEDLKAIDFKAKDDFNPIRNMNFEGFSFTRKFVGITSVVNEALKKTKNLSKKEGKPVNKKDGESKKKCLQEASKVRVQDIIENIMSIQNLSSVNSIRLREADEEKMISPKTYKATLNPNGVDFKNMYLISDIASDSGGVIQLSSIFNKSTRVQSIQYTKKGLMEMAYDNKKQKKDPSGKKIEPNEPLKDDAPVVVDRFVNNLLKKLGEEDIISDEAMNLSRIFNVNISLSRAIIGLNLFDRIEISSSLMGIYDGTWIITQIEYEYDNGILSQTVKALPEPLSDISKNAQMKKYINSVRSMNKK